MDQLDVYVSDSMPLTRLRTMAPARRCWSAVCGTDLAASALDAARAVAERLRDPRYVAVLDERAAAQSRLPVSGRRELHGLAQGHSGMAVLFGQLDRCFHGEGWDVAAHRHLELAVRGAERSANFPVGLFGGLAGLTFATRYLSRNGDRYCGLQKTLDSALSAHSFYLASQARSALRSRALPRSTVDLVSGVTGVAACLLDRPEGSRGLTESLEVVVTDSLNVVSAPSLDCGMAHGLSGSLALMALALAADVTVLG
ncbi:MAG: hypothetical protein M3Q75_08115, partial [Gemmatimonadota bacterium]|nr:hypothetical protein [Gemmatimonadota bacterium]